MKNIFKYLRRTKNVFLVYGGEEELVVTGYTDASFQTDKDDSKSQSGYVFTITAFGRLELEWCERKILLGWLELELVAGVV